MSNQKCIYSKIVYSITQLCSTVLQGSVATLSGHLPYGEDVHDRRDEPEGKPRGFCNFIKPLCIFPVIKQHFMYIINCEWAGTQYLLLTHNQSSCTAVMGLSTNNILICLSTPLSWDKQDINLILLAWIELVTKEYFHYVSRVPYN